MNLNLARGRFEDRAARSEGARAAARPRTSRRGLVFEGLEDRRLLTASLPDIALTSATTSDSKSVTVEYDVTPQDLGAPISFGVFRSADDRFDAGDLPVGSV